MELYNTTHCSIYNDEPAQNMKTYRILEIYNTNTYGIYNNIHICIFSQPKKIKGTMPISINQGIQRLTPPPSKIVLGFTSFPGSPKSIVKVKYASDVQHYNPAPLFLIVNNYQLIVLGHIPKVHLIPSGNDNDQNKSISNLPFLC